MLGILIVFLVIIGSIIYNFVYFSKYQTISRPKSFLYGIGYVFILLFTLFYPILTSYEKGTGVTIIAAIIGLAITGAIFYAISKVRFKKLKDIYADDKYIAIKEIIACIGVVFGCGFVLVQLFLPFLNKRD